MLTSPSTHDDGATIADGLMAAVAQGDHGAFDALYDRLAPPIYGMVCAVVQDRAQAEDVVREAFVELWRTAFGYRADQGGAHAWAMTIAHRHAAERARATQEQRGRSPTTRVEEVLTDLERESIALGYYGALSYHDVAKTLRVTSGTVTHRMRSGLRRLQDGPASAGETTTIRPG